MKSNVCEIKGKKQDLEIVLREVEKAASYNSLERAKTLQLMLLSEELIGIPKGILGFVKGNFYMENTGNEYRLCLHADISTDLITQERFVELSTQNRNEATRGIIGKIKYIANYLLSGDVATMPDYGDFYGNMQIHCYVPGGVYDNAWSLGSYRSGVARGTKEWDELEHSIVANLADDLIVGATAQYIELVAVKNF